MAGVVLLSNEKLKAFEFAIHALLKKSQINPNRITTIITDFDLQIRQAFRAALPNVNLLVCRWHVRKNIIAYIKSGLKPGRRITIASNEAGEDTANRAEEVTTNGSDQSGQASSEYEEDDEGDSGILTDGDGGVYDEYELEPISAPPQASPQPSTPQTSTPAQDPLVVAFNRFNALASTPNAGEYQKRKVAFLTDYGPLSTKIAGWFDREKAWAECYTRWVPRLGSVSTQRVESNHAALKLHLLNKQSHLDRLVHVIDGMLTSTINQFLDLNYKNSTYMPLNCPPSMLELRGKISRYLYEILEKYHVYLANMPSKPREEEGELRVFFKLTVQENEKTTTSIHYVVVQWSSGEIPPLCQCGQSISDLYPCWHEFAVVVERYGLFPLRLINPRWLVTENPSVNPLPALPPVSPIQPLPETAFYEDNYHVDTFVSDEGGKSLAEIVDERSKLIEHLSLLINRISTEHSDPSSVLSEMISLARTHLAQINPQTEDLSFDLESVRPKGKPPKTRRILSHDEEGGLLGKKGKR